MLGQINKGKQIIIDFRVRLNEECPLGRLTQAPFGGASLETDRKSQLSRETKITHEDND